MKLTLEVDDALMAKVMDINCTQDPQLAINNSLYDTSAKTRIEDDLRTGEAFLYKPAKPGSPTLFEVIHSLEELEAAS